MSSVRPQAAIELSENSALLFARISRSFSCSGMVTARHGLLATVGWRDPENFCILSTNAGSQHGTPRQVATHKGTSNSTRWLVRFAKRTAARHGWGTAFKTYVLSCLCRRSVPPVLQDLPLCLFLFFIEKILWPQQQCRITRARAMCWLSSS